MSLFFAPYVSVAEKARRARKEIERLRRSGIPVHPIAPFKGAVAKTFWGRSWCENLEQYADYQNRIGRGRSYVRNGFICDLAIERGYIRAIVYGTHSYDVTVRIKTLEEERWKVFCASCAGRIGSLVDLLQGKFSKDIMEMACNRDTGLFPRPDEISFSCSCPDWASMCKHVAAVLFAIGRRLDTEPDLFFTLRGVDASELFAADISIPETEPDATLDGERLADIFGIDLDGIDGDPGVGQTVETFGCEKPEGLPVSPPDLECITGSVVRKLRDQAGMSELEFASALAVCPATVRRWESTAGSLRLRADSITALRSFRKKYCAAGV